MHERETPLENRDRTYGLRLLGLYFFLLHRNSSFQLFLPLHNTGSDFGTIGESLVAHLLQLLDLLVPVK